jgi:hypothetical protein
MVCSGYLLEKRLLCVVKYDNPSGARGNDVKSGRSNEKPSAKAGLGYRIFRFFIVATALTPDELQRLEYYGGWR